MNVVVFNYLRATKKRESKIKVLILIGFIKCSIGTQSTDTQTMMFKIKCQIYNLTFLKNPNFNFIVYEPNIEIFGGVVLYRHFYYCVKFHLMINY